MIKYKKVKVLGQGSYGQAVLVESKKDAKKRFVIKEVQIAHLSYKERMAAQSEAKVLSQMSHSNICGYVESFVEGSKLYIVMDFADGGDLSGAVERRKKAGNPFTEVEVMNIFVQICLALRHVHERKILHRDLKSQNIFLTKNGVVKLGDFGIAKVLDSTADCARTQIGTPYYLSPEICEDRPYGKKADVWSLGCVLYELCLLQVPFQASNMPALVRKILYADPPKISGRYSNDLKLLAFSLLKKNPDDRPSITQILRGPYTQRHIATLLSHTITKGTGGVERLAQQRPRRISSARRDRGDDASSVASNDSRSNQHDKERQEARRKRAETYLNRHGPQGGEVGADLPQPRFEYKYRRPSNEVIQKNLPEPRYEERPRQDPKPAHRGPDMRLPGYDRDQRIAEQEKQRQMELYHQQRAKNQNHYLDMQRAGIERDSRPKNVESIRQDLARKEFLRNQEMARKNRERLNDQRQNPQIQIFGGQQDPPEVTEAAHHNQGAVVRRQSGGRAPPHQEQDYDMNAFKQQYFANREAARAFKARAEAEMRGPAPYSARSSSREETAEGEARIREVQNAKNLEKEAEKRRHEEALAEAYRRQREDQKQLRQKVQGRQPEGARPGWGGGGNEIDADATLPMNQDGRRRWSNSYTENDSDPEPPKKAENIKTREEELAEAYKQQREERRALRKKIEERKKQEEGLSFGAEELNDDVLPMDRGGPKSWDNPDSGSDVPGDADQNKDDNIKSREEELAEAHRQQREERRALRKKLEERKKQGEASNSLENLDNDATLPMNQGGRKPWDDFDAESGSDNGEDGHVIEDANDDDLQARKKKQEDARLEDMKRREAQLEEARQQAYKDRKLLKQKKQVPVSMVIDVDMFSEDTTVKQGADNNKKPLDAGDEVRNETPKNQKEEQEAAKPNNENPSRRRKRWGNPGGNKDGAGPVPVPIPVHTERNQEKEGIGPVSAPLPEDDQNDKEEEAMEQTSPRKKVTKEEARKQAREAFRLLRRRQEKFKRHNDDGKPKKGRGRRPHPYRDNLDKKDKAKELEAMLGKLAEMQDAVKNSLDAVKPPGNDTEQVDANDAVKYEETTKPKLDPKYSMSEDDGIYDLADSVVENAAQELDKFISDDAVKIEAIENANSDYEDEDVADMRCDLARALCIDDDDDQDDGDDVDLSRSKHLSGADNISKNMVEITKAYIEPKQNT